MTMQFDPIRLKRRVKLRDLHTLVTVDAVGGIRKAAKQLHLSQPAVSKAVAELEHVLGVILLDRSRRGVSITPAGQALLRRAAVIFDELQQGARELEHLSDPYSGHVELACSETINAGVVSEAIARMTRKYPRVSFGLDSGEAPALISKFLKERVSDFVIARPYAPVLDPDIHAEPLFREKLQVVVSRWSTWGKRRKIGLAELVGERWILSRNEAMSNSPVVEAFRNVGHDLPARTLLAGSLNLRYRLLAEDGYVTLMPRSLLRFGAAARFPLKVLPIDIPSWPTPTMILSLANRSLTPVASTFLDIVRDVSRRLDA
jgi:DNA-binding transcriptional LysR family regulator